MRQIFYTAQFKKDFKGIQKQNKDISKLKTVISPVKRWMKNTKTTPGKAIMLTHTIATLAPIGY